MKKSTSFAVRALALAVALSAAVAATVAIGSTPKIRLDTQVIGNSTMHAGSMAALRIITVDHMSGSSVGGAGVQIDLIAKDAKEPSRAFTGKTNPLGSLDARFRVPDAPGSYTMRVVSRAMGEVDQIETPITVKRENRVLLTTDKPLYQPGQMMYIRTLALRLPSLKAAAGADCMLEVMDGRGNKVYKNKSKLNPFGIASAEFQLATEVNQGKYTVRATVDDQPSEKTVTVERYVLPKFKVRLEMADKFYQPAQVASGSVHSDYFFGKPVSQAKVNIKLSKFDVGFNEFAEITGETDAAGVFKFEQKLPADFVGQPLEQGNAFFQAEASVTDGAGHTEKATVQVPVAADALKVIALPESGALAAGLENVIYIVTSNPLGDAAQASFTVTSGSKSLKGRTDELGLGEVRLTPEAGAAVSVRAEDAKGAVASFGIPSTGEKGAEAILLRPERVTARVGEQLDVSIFTTRKAAVIYLDAVKDGQTLLATTAASAQGRAGQTIDLTPDMTGTLTLHAYRVTPDGNIIRDSRRIVVLPATGLDIKLTADKKQYLPGEPAKLHFSVADDNGKPVAAALGVSIVDESVFALQEMHPGLERLYFLLEKELSTPKYEVHSFTRDDLVKPWTGRSRSEVDDRQLGAAALLAASEPADDASGKPFSLIKSSYTEKIEKVREQLAERAKADLKVVEDAVHKFNESGKGDLAGLGGVHYLVQEGLLPASRLVDQWGKTYQVVGYPEGSYTWSLGLVSSGPDRRSGTVDDVLVATQRGRRDDFLVLNGAWDDADGDVWFGDRGIAFGGAMGVFRAKMDMPQAGEERLMLGVPLAAASRSWAMEPKSSATAPEVRIRSYFPETLYFNPSVITDGRGQATVSLDMADSITSWRVAAMGNSATGALGSLSQGLKVFQDFFIDIDLPVALTQNDQVSIPIAVYNYLPSKQKVRLVITEEPWFKLTGPAEQTLVIDSSSVRSVQFPIQATGLGWQKLTVHAYGEKMNDAIRRDIEILPDGQRVEQAESGRLSGSVKHVVNIPDSSIPGSSNILVRIYPGIFSQIIEGMDSLLRMPSGCFEQTSSVTYPNVLILDYMRKTRQSSPEVQMKAEQYISLGYQRLVSYECKSGGFEWFGNDPANQVLTAYGLLEFSDMAAVYEVDPALIARTQAWLLGKQNKDGSWTPDKGGIAEGAINRQTDEFRTTAYILWALGQSKAEAAALCKGLAFLEQSASKVDDAYAIAVAANAALSVDPKGKFAASLLNRLSEMRKVDGDAVYWTTDGNTAVSSTGKTADVETTAIAAFALIRSGGYSDIAMNALTYLVKAKSPAGAWDSTQATVFALKALMAAAGGSSDVNAEVSVIVNGKQAGSFKITPDNSDVLRQVDCKGFIRSGDNTVSIEFSGKGSALYQVSSYYYVPWGKVMQDGKDPISIDVSYDRTKLAADDIVTAHVKTVYNGVGAANMVIVDLGVAPGFDVIPDELEKLVETKAFQKYSLTPRQVIIYIEKLDAGKPLEFDFRMKARFPIKAKTPRSAAYQYYNPSSRGVSPPQEIEVTGG